MSSAPSRVTPLWRPLGRGLTSDSEQNIEETCVENQTETKRNNLGHNTKTTLSYITLPLTHSYSNLNGEEIPVTKE